LLKTNDTNDLGLLIGKKGITLFNFYYSQITIQEEYFKIGTEVIEDIIGNINSVKITSYCGGLAGVYWGFEHIIEKGFIECNSYELLEELD